MIVNIKRIKEIAVFPKKAYFGDAGLDFFSCENETIVIPPGEKYQFKLGWAIEIPPDYFGLIQAKSGRALKEGLETIGNVIDSNYRGEISAICLNTSKKNIVVDFGEKICQLIIIPTPNIGLVESKELHLSERGEKGYGSSGVKIN